MNREYDTYCPMPLVVHAVAPSASLYLPDGQYKHALEPSSAAYLPDGQYEHVLEPASAAYLPTGHVVHVVPSPAYPVAQTLHAAADVDPVLEVVYPSGQLDTADPPSTPLPSGNANVNVAAEVDGKYCRAAYGTAPFTSPTKLMRAPLMRSRQQSTRLVTTT